MKRFLATAVLVLASVPAMAQHHGHYRNYGYHNHGYYRGGGGWVAPLILGGVVGYAITRDPVIVQQPPVVVQPAPIPGAPIGNVPYCGPWIETQQPDGTIVRQRTCTQ